MTCNPRQHGQNAVLTSQCNSQRAPLPSTDLRQRSLAILDFLILLWGMLSLEHTVCPLSRPVSCPVRRPLSCHRTHKAFFTHKTSPTKSHKRDAPTANAHDICPQQGPPAHSNEPDTAAWPFFQSHYSSSRFDGSELFNPSPCNVSGGKVPQGFIQHIQLLKRLPIRGRGRVTLAHRQHLYLTGFMEWYNVSVLRADFRTLSLKLEENN